MTMQAAAANGKILALASGKLMAACCCCSDPNGCVGMSHLYRVVLSGTPWDGVYDVKLFTCGYRLCADPEEEAYRHGGSGWTARISETVRLVLYWTCQPEPYGQWWWVGVEFVDASGTRRISYVKGAGADPCDPVGSYSENTCSNDENSYDRCWAEWSATFSATVSLPEIPGKPSSIPHSGPAKRHRHQPCSNCRGL